LNVDWLARLPAPARRGLYFALQRAVGSRIGPIWREFLSWETLSQAAHDAAVGKRLFRILDHATRSSEYYRDLAIPPRDGESAVDWLRRFPILTRRTVREEFPRFVSDALRAEIPSPASVSTQRYGWLVVSTGGTTGVPTTVVHDPAARDWGRATRLYAARASGFPLGVPYFRLWGSEADLFKVEAALHLRIQRALLGEILLNAFKAREEDLLRHHAAMRVRPDIHHMMAYVDAAATLAMFITDRALPRPRLRSVQACAGTVTPDFRKVIEETFSCRVFDKYGSRECTDMACECSHHTGLHVFSPNCFLEIVDDNGNACAPGQLGRVLVTNLNNRTFPLIRYEIGDVAAWSKPGPCPCGSPFPRLRGVEGRQDDLLVTEDGHLQSSIFVRHFVGVSLNRHLIREWQLEQTDSRRFVFRYVPIRSEGLSENLAALDGMFRRFLGNSITVDFEEVSGIAPSRTGKVRWILNSYRNTSSSLASG
jgi:phenylacetate-CoA ligase